jgi:hypothetical protein
MTGRFLAGATILWIALPAGDAIAQDQDQEEQPITLVGCVMRESQYRDMYGPGLSGPRGAGIGGRNEYMLVDAHEMTSGVATATTNTAIAAATTDTRSCPPSPGTFPTAYELTGSREDELASFLGRRVEVTGIRKEANARPVGTSGTLRPTGGFDPLGHELHLFEVEVESFREPTPALAETPPAAPPAPPPARAEAPAPAPEPAPSAPEPAITAAAPEPAPEPAPVPQPAPEPEQTVAAEEPPQQVAELPRTASPLPLAGLIGFASLAAAAGLRAVRRRRQTRSH